MALKFLSADPHKGSSMGSKDKQLRDKIMENDVR